MDKYFQYTFDTIGSYSKSMKKRVVNNLINNGYVSKLKQEGITVLDENDDNNIDMLQHYLSKDNKLIKEIEKWEFNKFYRYSIYFTINNIDEIMDLISSKVVKGKIIDYESLEEEEVLKTVIDKPSYYKRGDNYFLKFNIRFKVTDIKGIEHKKRYPIVVCFEEGSNICELCYDAIENVYGIDKSVYVEGVKDWLKSNISPSLEYLDLGAVVEYIIKNGERDNVYTILQNMALARGGIATLGVGKNIDNIMPFIGEIKEIIEMYRNDLEANNHDFLEEIDQYFDEVDELSEYPWVQFKFANKKIEIKLTKILNSNGGYLLQHYSNQAVSNQDRERMDYVKRYIAIVKTRINENSEQ